MKEIAKQLDRSVLAPDQIHSVTGAKRRKYLMKPERVLKCIQAYKDRCLKECFPERNWIHSSLSLEGEGRGEGVSRMEWFPKTLIFAKDDVHGCTSVASAGRARATDDHCDRIVDAVREVFTEGIYLPGLLYHRAQYKHQQID